MTIVGIGTSVPEMVISFFSAARGNAGMAIGNVVGSNIFNTLVITGITALIIPVGLTKNSIRKDIPYAFMASLMLFVFANDSFFDSSPNIISRTDGIALIIFFIIFLAYTYFSVGKISHNVPYSGSGTKRATGEYVEKKSVSFLWLITAGGLAALLGGSEILINSALKIASGLGVPDSLIALSMVSVGTSLPELITGITAAIKKETGIAIGNILGSNISNIFLVLGGSAVIHPMALGNITETDLGVMLLSSVLLFISAFTFKKKYIDRYEGAIFLSIYIAYMLNAVGVLPF
jgi:cation:H+ antiporter